MITLRSVLYIIAFTLFIYGLMRMTGPRTAVRGNAIAAAGMAIAIIATLLTPNFENWSLVLLGLVVGTAIGVPAARHVRMTAMPQMVALFNGVGGGAVALIAWVEFRESNGFLDEPLQVSVPALFATIVGSVSFWGSLIAFGKLQELLPGRPITAGRAQLPMNAILFTGAIGCAVGIGFGLRHETLIVAALVLAALSGVAVVLPIGGADMPVVVSLLNALTGLSAAAAGLALNNTAMIVAGMLVGASGSILTDQMAKAMNRSIPSIVAGGFGGGSAASATAPTSAGTIRATSAADAAIQLTYANQVIIVPGYGMAVAQAQHTVRDMTKLLTEAGVEVSYAIHPVAGRMPGHMNVLLAEADVPYEQLREMDDINEDFSRADVALVIGANDVTNPAARTDSRSPIYGMPVLNVDQAKTVIVLKRSMGSGFAGVNNPLYTEPNTSMLFGDAKASVRNVVEELKGL